MSNKIYTESYPCSSIIDNTNITNSLEYLEYHSIIEKNNTKDMIKLNNRLYNTYGKYNKSLESYLINNANTSKENYNNYINTNKELYNELIMSRESVIGGIIVLGSGLIALVTMIISIIKSVKKSIFKTAGKYDTKKLAQLLLKDKKIYEAINKLKNDIQVFDKQLSEIPKNKIINDIKLLIEPHIDKKYISYNVKFYKMNKNIDVEDILNMILFKQKNNIDNNVNNLHIFNINITISYKNLNYDENNSVEDNSLNIMKKTEKNINKLEPKIINIIKKYSNNVKSTIIRSENLGKDYFDSVYRFDAALPNDHSNLISLITKKIN